MTEGYKVKKIFLWSEQVRPSWTKPLEIYYDFRWGSLAWFQAAWWKDIYTNGGYAIYSDGLWQTLGSNDRRISAVVDIDISSAKKITLEREGYWIRWAWSNWKCIILSSSSSSTEYWTAPILRGTISLNTSAPETYSENGICYYLNLSSWTKWTNSLRYYVTAEGTTKQKLEVDLTTWVCNYATTGADNNSYSITLTSAELNNVKAMKAAIFHMARWYSTYNGERMHTIYVKIEY